MNGGLFDGGQSTEAEKDLRSFYKTLLNFTIGSPALMGSYAEMQSHNRSVNPAYHDKLYAFARWSKEQKLMVVANFSAENGWKGSISIPKNIQQAWALQDGEYSLKNALNTTQRLALKVTGTEAKVELDLQPLQSVILVMQ
jgi:hypothetical protein